MSRIQHLFDSSHINEAAYAAAKKAADTPQPVKVTKPTVDPFEHLTKREAIIDEERKRLAAVRDPHQKLIKKAASTSATVVPSPSESVKQTPFDGRATAKDFINELFQNK